MARKGSAEWRQRVSRGAKRGIRRRKERLRTRPRDLERLRAEGLVTESLRPLAAIAEDECFDLIHALGGVDQITPQRRAIVEDVARVGLVLRAELARYVESRDPDCGARVGSLANSRRSSLVALGLERLEREINLKEYLAQRAGATEVATGEANDSHDNAEVVSEEVHSGDTAADRTGGRS